MAAFADRKLGDLEAELGLTKRQIIKEIKDMREAKPVLDFFKDVPESRVYDTPEYWKRWTASMIFYESKHILSDKLRWAALLRRIIRDRKNESLDNL